MSEEKVTNEDLAKSIDLIAINLSKVIDNMATKDDLVELRKEMATKDDLVELRKEMATKDDLKLMVTKKEFGILQQDVVDIQSDIKSFKQEVRGEFSQVNSKLDGLVGTARIQDKRIEALEIETGILNKEDLLLKN